MNVQENRKSSSTSGIPPRSRILIVDEDTRSCERLASCLSGQGYECFWEDGVSLRRLRRFLNMDVIIVDLSISGWDGIDTLERIFADVSLRPALIFVSGLGSHTLDEARRYAEALGFEVLGCSAKPVDMLEIMTCLTLGEAVEKGELLPRGAKTHQSCRDVGSEIARFVRSRIDENAIEFWFVPRIDTSDGGFCGCEVEMDRLASPYGLISEAAIWQIARRSGRLEALATQQAQQAMRAAGGWIGAVKFHAGLATGIVFLRWPLDLLKVSGGADHLRDIAKAASIDPCCVTIMLPHIEQEIDAALSHNLVLLRKYGFSLGLDLFCRAGTRVIPPPLSSLPFSEIRLAPWFARRVEGANCLARSVQQNIALFRQLGFRVVVSGVNNCGQLAYLRDAGCSEISGPLIAGRMNGKDIAIWSAIGWRGFSGHMKAYDCEDVTCDHFSQEM